MRVRRPSGLGQIIVEMLLMLPVFLLLAFGIMEIGHLAFRTIVIHHTAYELARIASLSTTARASKSCEPPLPDASKVQHIGKNMLPRALVAVEGPIPTMADPQEGCMNYDVEVTVTESVPMVFPMTGLMLADKGSRGRRIRAAVRMPIERPLFK